MNVKDVMTQKPEYLSPNTPLKKVAENMYRKDFGFVPIGENDRLIGVVTDRDIAIRGVAQGKNPENTPVREVMTTKVQYCYEDDDLKKAADYMCDQHVRRLVVLNKNKRLTGILSLGDIATKCTDEWLCDHILKSVSEKTH
jgi:CBS domain-containing protein